MAAKQGKSAPSTSSPGTGRAMGIATLREQAKESINLADIMAAIQGSKTSVEALVETKSERLEKKVDKIQLQMEEINKRVEENRIAIKTIQENASKIDKEVKELKTQNQKTQEKAKSYNDATLVLEMDRASYVLRLRNVPEEKGEDLEKVISTSMAEFLEMEEEEMRREIDNVYRVNSSYARRTQTPREIYLTLSRRCLKDRILRECRDATLKIRGQEILILKQVPWKIRELRKQYFFLTKYLNKAKINFRWLTPEGVFVTWQSRRFRLDSVYKAREFYDKYFAEFADRRPEEETDSEGGAEAEVEAELEAEVETVEEEPRDSIKARDEGGTINDPEEIRRLELFMSACAAGVSREEKQPAPAGIKEMALEPRKTRNLNPKYK